MLTGRRSDERQISHRLQVGSKHSHIGPAHKGVQSIAPTPTSHHQTPLAMPDQHRLLAVRVTQLTAAAIIQTRCCGYTRAWLGIITSSTRCLGQHAVVCDWMCSHHNSPGPTALSQAREEARQHGAVALVRPSRLCRCAQLFSASYFGRCGSAARITRSLYCSFSLCFKRLRTSCFASFSKDPGFALRSSGRCSAYCKRIVAA